MEVNLAQGNGGVAMNPDVGHYILAAQPFQVKNWDESPERTPPARQNACSNRESRVGSKERMWIRTQSDRLLIKSVVPFFWLPVLSSSSSDSISHLFCRFFSVCVLCVFFYLSE